MATSDRSKHIGINAATLSLIEIGLGGLLHGLKIPLSGQFLSLNQGLILTRVSLESPHRLDVVYVSHIAALLKSLGPVGKKLTPMLALAMQGQLFFVGTLLLGHNIAGRLLGMALLCLWSFLQPVIIYLLLFGKDLKFMATYYLQKLQLFLPVTLENIASFFALLVACKILLGLILVCLVHLKKTQTLFSYQKKMLSLGRKGTKRQLHQGHTWQMALRDLTHPLFLFSMALSFIFFYFTKSHWPQRLWPILRALTLAYIMFYFSRSLNLQKIATKSSQGARSLFGKSLKVALEAIKKH